VNFLDLVVVLAALSAALGGYRLGLVARVFSWIGLGLGLYLAARFLPDILNWIKPGDPSSKLIVSSIVMIGGAFVGQGLGLIVGSQVHRVLPLGPLRTVDRVAGAVAGFVGVFAFVWIFLPLMSDVRGWPAREARNSSIARYIDRTLPNPPNTVEALRRIVGNTGFPQVFAKLGPAPQAGPPPADSGLPAAVLTKVSASTVKVEGDACSRIQEGSGFSVEADTIVTNAHVVAGEKGGHTDVLRPDGKKLRAQVVMFDSDRDIAVLRVPGLSQNPLPVGSAKRGSKGAVFGHPGGQDPLRIAPAGISDEVEALGRDLYDSHTTRRDVFILAAELHPGDSGGALVDPSGAVVGVAFAIAPDKPNTAYALSNKELQAALSETRVEGTSTGPCLTSG
jgi:S1-C subfamily serine protease